MEIHHRESFCLKRERFANNVSAGLFDLFTESNSYDVTLVSDDQVPFQAHQFVLSACSPVIRKLMINNPHPYPIIYLNGIKQTELKSILQFMYLGEIKFFKGKRSKLLEAAKNLQLKQLEETIVPEKTSPDIREETIPEFLVQKQYANSEAHFCKMCGFKANEKSKLRRHIKSLHNGESDIMNKEKENSF